MYTVNKFLVIIITNYVMIIIIITNLYSTGKPYGGTAKLTTHDYNQTEQF